MNFTEAPPKLAGRYWWRRSWQWVPVIREVSGQLTVYSHRYCQEVPVATIGGDWGPHE